MSVAHANRTNFMLRLKLIHKKSQFFLSVFPQRQRLLFGLFALGFKATSISGSWVAAINKTKLQGLLLIEQL